MSEKLEAHLFREIMATIHCDGGHYLAEHGPQKSYEAARAKWNNFPRPGDTPVPINEDQAAMMVLLGMSWLEEHAPHRLRRPPPKHVKLDCGCATVDGQQVMTCPDHNMEKPSG